MGAACSKPALTCGYGGGDDPFCRKYYRCDGTWKLPEDVTNTCTKNPDSFCPSEPPPQKEECVVGPAGTAPCSYEGLRCFCLSRWNEPGTNGIWACVGPPADTRCPASLPNIGEGCAVSGVECQYSVSGCGVHPYSSVFCFEGAWEPGSGPDCSE